MTSTENPARTPSLLWTSQGGLLLLLAAKVTLLALFSSDYQQKLFLPFVRHFLADLDNPYQYFYSRHLPVEFPYPPGMLYILSLGYLPLQFLPDSVLLQNLVFKLPTLFSDLLILFLLLRLFPGQRKEIYAFYFLSPIVLYASYIHSQLDLIPASLLFLSVYLLIRKRAAASAAVFGAALGTKFYVLSALPLILVYLLKNHRPRDLAYFLILPAAIYAALVFPYFGTGYFHMVLTHPKQLLLFETSFPLKGLQIYLPVFAALLVYARFFAYPKINLDLFYSFLAIVFCVFVLLVPPAPAWYLWMFPFLSIFYIRFHRTNTSILYSYVFLNATYLLFFVFFHQPDFQDLVFLGRPVSWKIRDERMINLAGTLLSAILSGTLFLFYRFGVRSNAIYRKGVTTVIGIGGDSGSGKTTLLGDIEALLRENLLCIEGDGDHRWERGSPQWQKLTHLDPKANELHGQAESLRALKQGQPVYRRDYDHGTGRFTPPVRLEPRPFIAISGLHAFYIPKMRKIIDVKIYLDTDDALRAHWKILRDTGKRGYSKEKVVDQLERRMPDSRKHIDPQKQFADCSIRYFTEGAIRPGNPEHPLPLRLKITLNSSIRLDPLLEEIRRRGIDASWDYSEDLCTQHLALDGESLGTEAIGEVAGAIIPNLEEIVADSPGWRDGNRGIVQLAVVILLSESLRGEEHAI